MDSVKSILSWERPSAPSLQDFRLDMSLEAAQHNWSTFESFERNLEKVSASDPNSIMAYGSKFKPLLASHPLWPHLKRILENGSDPPRDRLDEASRQLALEAALRRGNHKSAKSDESSLAALLIDDVTRGYSLQVCNTPGLSLQPMEVTIQNTIDEQNEIISKKGLTHDSSFEVLDGIPSHNKRIKMEELVACRFGWALLRILHLVVSLRERNPTTPIYTQKIDWSKAYVANTARQAQRWNAQLSAATYCWFHFVSLLAALRTRPNSATAVTAYAISQTSSFTAQPGTLMRFILRSRVRSPRPLSPWIRRVLSLLPSRSPSMYQSSRSAKRTTSSTTSSSLFWAIPETSSAAMPPPL
jgi:hypothetical protein